MARKFDTPRIQSATFSLNATFATLDKRQPRQLANFVENFIPYILQAIGVRWLTPDEYVRERLARTLDLIRDCLYILSQIGPEHIRLYRSFVDQIIDDPTDAGRHQAFRNLQGSAIEHEAINLGALNGLANTLLDLYSIVGEQELRRGVELFFSPLTELLAED